VAQTNLIIGRSNAWAWLRPVSFAGLLIALLCFGLFRQPHYPAVWQDEGFVLQGAMNVVRIGQYAMRSSEGYRILDQPLIANGPGVVLPISAAFAVFGIGLLQARLVAVTFFCAAALAFLALGRRLYGPAAGAVSLCLLLAVPVHLPGATAITDGFVLYGRYAMGNVPALAYFLGGYLLWLSAAERGGAWRAILAGSLFGVAAVTKGQYDLVAPALVLTAILERKRDKDSGRKAILSLLAMIACVTLWFAVQFALVGSGGFEHHLEAIRSSSAVTVAAFRPSRVLGSLAYLLRSGLAVFVGPGVVYAFWTCRSPTFIERRQLLLVAIVLIWLPWYVFVSVGWPRYAFEPYALGLLFSGRFLVDAATFLRTARNTCRPARGVTRALVPAASVMLGLAAASSLLGLGERVLELGAAPDLSAEDFARDLRSSVPPTARVESWEWAIDGLADLNFHHPTNDWVDRYTAVLQLHDPLPATYPVMAFEPEYLVDGPFSKWTGIYRQELDRGCCTLVRTDGPYDLYQVRAARVRESLLSSGPVQTIAAAARVVPRSAPAGIRPPW
jgi:4-amino-4-deoxy-L-arabinose transferase-like glycosyltransferase